VGLASIFYSVRFETSLFVASYYSQGYGGGIFEPASTRDTVPLIAVFLNRRAAARYRALVL
jgi:hypothetical protein